MLILYSSILLLLFLHHGVYSMTATAVLYRDSTNVTGGTVTFFQNDVNALVNVSGTISGLNASTVHVCLIKQMKDFLDYYLF